MQHHSFKEILHVLKHVWMQLSYQVLAPGATKDASAILVDFLGREPTQEAFLRSKGL